MRLRALRSSSWLKLSLFAMLLACNACSNSGSNSGTNGDGNTAPAAPTNLAATAGNQQASLTWTASSGATSYNVKRGTASGGPYTTVGTPAGTTYADTKPDQRNRILLRRDGCGCDGRKRQFQPGDRDPDSCAHRPGPSP